MTDQHGGRAAGEGDRAARSAGGRQHAALKALDHVGFNVPDIDEGIAFFRDVLGCVVLGRQDRHPFSLDPTATVAVAMLRFDEHTVFELLEFRRPGQTGGPAPMTDPAGYHLALTVDDLDAAVDWLRRQPGVTAEEPVPLPGGRRRAFCTTPWGMTLQLITAAGEDVY